MRRKRRCAWDEEEEVWALIVSEYRCTCRAVHCTAAQI